MAGTSAGLPPGGLLEIVFSFDTTGSMSSILDEVRGRLQDMIQRLQSDIGGIRIGVIAHGDYCDKDVFYLTKELDLCQNVAELCQFVKDIEGTGGGDADECYELVLRMVRQNFSWTPASQKILVMIGDANPHEPDYELNTDNIDWREELKLMNAMKIKVYSVQVFNNDSADAFYQSLASETDGNYLRLTEFSNICDFMMAICYRERGEDFLMNYENEVRSRFEDKNDKRLKTTGALPTDLEGMFGTLRRDDSLGSMSSASSVSLKRKASDPIATNKPLPKIARVIPLAAKKDDVTKVTGIEKKRKTKLKNEINMKKKKTKNAVTKEFRENIPNSKFDSQCHCKTSTKWKLVYSPDKPDIAGWRCCRLRNNDTYWKKKLPFPKLLNDQGIYELAVQTRPKCRLHVVYSFTVDSKKTSEMQTTRWERFLFQFRSQTGRVKKIVRNVCAKNGCRIFLRRIQYSKKTDSKSNQYDFAWQSWRHRQPRPVKKNGICISALPGQPMDID